MEWLEYVLIAIAATLAMRWIILGIIEELEDRGWRRY